MYDAQRLSAKSSAKKQSKRGAFWEIAGTSHKRVLVLLMSQTEKKTKNPRLTSEIRRRGEPREQTHGETEQ